MRRCDRHRDTIQHRQTEMDEDEDEGATDKDERWVPRRCRLRYSVKMKTKMKMMAEDDGMGRACKIILILEELLRSQIIRRFAKRSSKVFQHSPCKLFSHGWMWLPLLNHRQMMIPLFTSSDSLIAHRPSLA